MSEQSNSDAPLSQQSIDPTHMEPNQPVKNMILYADAGVKPNPGFCGWGIHGYTFSLDVPKKGSGNPTAIPTKNGYVMKQEIKNSKELKADDEEVVSTQFVPVTPINYIDGFGSVLKMSNNAGEVVAATNAARIAANNLVNHLTIFTDSRYVVDGATDRLHKWQANNWNKADGRPLENTEQWKQLSEALNDLKVKNISFDFKWVKGHNGHIGNCHADQYATIGRTMSALGELKNVVNTSPPDGYWGNMHERHPLLHHVCAYMTTAMASVDTGEYYIGNHGKDDDVIGKRDTDGAYAYLQLNEPDQLIELVKKKICSIASRADLLVLCGLNTLFGLSTANTLMRFGQDALMRPNKYRLDMDVPDSISGRQESKNDEDPKRRIVSEINPPLIAIRTIDALNELKGVYLDFKNNPESKLVKTDITSVFFSADKKGKTKFTSDIISGMISVKVKGCFNQNQDQMDFTLTLGVDLPDRNTLKKIEAIEPKVTLIVWSEATQAIRYATIIETSTGSGIWAGYYSNLIYLKEVKK